jgi:hypothetical protein
MAQTPQDIRRGLLHAELAGNILANKREAIRLRAAVMQVEAVVKMLQPGFNVASIAAKRRNKSNPWFKRGTRFGSAVDVLRQAQAPMTAREIADTLIAGKAPQATRKQAVDVQGARGMWKQGPWLGHSGTARRKGRKRIHRT